MSSRPAKTLFHALAASMMLYGYRGLGSMDIDAWMQRQVGGHFQFLTIQGLVVAWITMVLCLATDLFPSVLVFRACKRAVFMISMPTEFVVFSIYWTLIVLFPELILISKPSDSTSGTPVLSRPPFHIDLALHVIPVLSLTADFVLFEHKYTKNETTRNAPLAIGLSTIWYSLWVEYCAGYNGYFPYPFLTNNPPHIRLVIYVFSGGLALVSFWVINACHPGRLPNTAEKKL